LTVEARPFGKSLMYVRNNSGPSTDPELSSNFNRKWPG